MSVNDIGSQFVGFNMEQLSSQPMVVGWGTTTDGGTPVNALRQVGHLLSAANR